MKSAVIRALKQTQEGLQSLKDSPRYVLRYDHESDLWDLRCCRNYTATLSRRDLYIVYAINAFDNFNYFSLSLLFTLYLTEEFGFTDQQVWWPVDITVLAESPVIYFNMHIADWSLVWSLGMRHHCFWLCLWGSS